IEEPTDAFLALAEIHLRNKRWDDCEQCVQRIKKYDKKTSQKVQYIYGLMEDKKAEDVTLGDAGEHFKKLGSSYDKAADFFKKKSVEAMESEKRMHWSMAESHFEQALGEHPWTWTKVWVLLIEEKMKLGKWQDALKEANFLLNSDKI